MVKRLSFPPGDRDRIAEAIREAERSTSGEIFAVFAHRSDNYVFVSAFVCVAFALLSGLIAAGLAWLFGYTVPALWLAGAQVVGAGALSGVLALSERLRLLFVPASVKADRAHRTALTQFLAHGLHMTEARTGVLLFVSEAEHHAEVVADAGINAKVAPEEWDAIVGLLIRAAREDRIADGFVEAICQSGRLLAVHFPPGAGNPDEVPNRLVEI